MKIEVVVSEKDISEGIRNDGIHCPVALALKRAMGADYVEVTEDLITIKKGYSQSEYHTPMVAATFIEHFDDQEEVSPISFFLGEEDES